jgi:hypothetical protein
MLAAVAALIVAVALLVSGAAKLADPAGTRAALSTYGISRPGPSAGVWATLVVVELLLAASLVAGVRPAAWAAVALFTAFAVAQVAALAAGRAGAACGCLGARGRLSPRSAARAGALAAGALLVAVLPRPALTTEQWLGIGLGFALLGVAGLAVVVLALAREVGILRLAVTPQGALEVPHEGPEIGGRIPLADSFADDLGGGRLGLAVFTSEGCAMCRALGPVISAFGRHPRVALRTFDEVGDADAWNAADVPGSPYAVALDADGVVLAKGTFNSGGQLESVLATAERRRAGRPSPHPPQRDDPDREVSR